MLLPTTSAMTGLVEAVRITDPSAWRTEAGTVAGETVDRWDDAQEVLALVSALPGGSAMRCFLPGFGIRAHAASGGLFAGQVLFEIAFCFSCRWARFLGAAVTPGVAGQPFDPTSAPARELLRRFRESAAAAG
ncbi:hypothetical protein OG689_05150 [Kitasatospora sp. NBC_00240]|uniref:hypothetical protein n=1 Tax=Kitasatospora sp. NBC_00240 TaxID=2903567 RepID=UPI002258A444|nr:hypothetical protein [Kitasatospora sp. NBC_00240]MCX5208685.1 hypothetical protein [Kitasatospora sp. NBC_00240]